VDWDVAAILSVLAGLGSILSAVTVWRRYAPEAAKLKAEAKKLAEETEAVKADVASQITETAVSLIDPLRAEVRELRQALADREEELRRLRAELEEARIGRAERERRIDALTCRVADLENACAEKDRLIAAYEARIKELESEIRELRKQIGELTEERAK
jgi:chromosome segregation ATPase